MDALGSTCGSEDCTRVLSIQDGKSAIGCTKAQQAQEDVGTITCKSLVFQYPISGSYKLISCIQGSLNSPAVQLSHTLRYKDEIRRASDEIAMI